MQCSDANLELSITLLHTDISSPGMYWTRQTNKRGLFDERIYGITVPQQQYHQNAFKCPGDFNWSLPEFTGYASLSSFALVSHLSIANISTEIFIGTVNVLNRKIVF